MNATGSLYAPRSVVLARSILNTCLGLEFRLENCEPLFLNYPYVCPEPVLVK